MRWQWSVLVVGFFTFMACSNSAPPRPDWATSVNRGLASPSYSVKSVSVTIESIKCGTTKEEAYLVDVSWTVSGARVDAVRVEYEIIPSGRGHNQMFGNPVLALESRESPGYGATTIKLPASEIVEIGYKLLLRAVAVVNSEETNSPVAEQEFTKLCP